jgi:hypothetical protein
LGQVVYSSRGNEKGDFRLKEIQGDLWDFLEKGHWIVIPTNGSIKKNGEAIMGRGLALEAKQKFPSLPKELGEHIRAEENTIGDFHRFRLITFPVKDKWYEKADLDLIEHMCRELVILLDKEFATIPSPVYIPRVGCGNGRLKWEDVKPILERHLDDKFIVVHREGELDV